MRIPALQRSASIWTHDESPFVILCATILRCDRLDVG